MAKKIAPPIKVELTNPIQLRVDAMVHRPARELEHERNNVVHMAELALDVMIRAAAAPKKEG